MTSPVEGETLGAILTRRFDELYDTPRRIKQTEVAKAMKVQQSTVSKIMRDELDAGNRKPEQVEALLKGFRFSEREMIALAARFALRLPEKYTLAYLNNRGNALPNSAIVDVLSLRGAIDGGALPMPQFFLGDHKPEDCRYLELTDDVLVCERVRQELTRGHILAVAVGDKPRETDYAVYRFKGMDKFAVVVHNPSARTTSISSIDRHEGDVLRQDDKRLELVGTGVGSYTQGRRSEHMAGVN